MLMDILLIVLYICCLVAELAGHGVMQNPPARNYMWRLGFDTEINYNDVGLNCGGYRNQWESNGGRCGTCGDPFQGPREHEAGGLVATINRPISRCYQTNWKIDVTISITAYHKGYFEFRLCEHNDLRTPVTQACLDRTILTISGTNLTRYNIDNFQRLTYTFQLDIPRDVTCQQCVIQWLYNTGNSYGCDANSCGMGIGPQEQFINCADIAILPDCTDFNTQTSTSPPTDSSQTNTRYTGNTWTTNEANTWTTDEDDTWKNDGGDTWTTDQDETWTTDNDNTWTNDDNTWTTDEDDTWTTDKDNTWTTDQENIWTTNQDNKRTTGQHNTWTTYQDNTWKTNQHDQHTTTARVYQSTNSWQTENTHGTTLVSHGLPCHGIGMFADVSGSDNWCSKNCYAEKPFCPTTHCRCGAQYSEKKKKLCIAVGLWGKLPGFSQWCNINCNYKPQFCPTRLCLCL